MPTDLRASSYFVPSPLAPPGHHLWRHRKPHGLGVVVGRVSVQEYPDALAVADRQTGRWAVVSGSVERVLTEAMIEDAGRRLAAAAGSPARVLLFGSRARGGAHANSDLDFLVIEAQVDSKLDEMVRLRDTLPPLGVPVDVVVVSEEEVSRRGPVPSTLVHRALREGRFLAAT